MSDYSFLDCSPGISNECVYRDWPPSTSTKCPVIKEAAGDSRKHTKVETEAHICIRKIRYSSFLAASHSRVNASEITSLYLESYSLEGQSVCAII